MSGRVTVVRDRYGIPHISASTQHDLFFAQGFVQAQDRLFQLDLWRRSVQGRLAEVLGANFIERDAMTRRIQYRGSLDAEWASYGSDAREIAAAFTDGINAWITQTRDRLPEEFALAGWTPETWAPEDLLNRTEAFLASDGAAESLLCAQLLGAIRAGSNAPGSRFCPPPSQTDVDLAMINDSVAGMVRRVGTRPFFTGLSAPVPGRQQPDAPVVPQAFAEVAPATAGFAFALNAARSATRAPLLASSWIADLENPAVGYLVHLTAPGWNAIGVTVPWRPGVAMGHNDEMAWVIAPGRPVTQQIFVERLNQANPHQVETPQGWRDLTVEIAKVAVKGRSEPFESEQMFGPHGPIFALDRERQLAYAVRWTGLEAGGAAGLGALAIARARSRSELDAALERWRMPAAIFVFADKADVSTRLAGRILTGPTLLPAAGWRRERPVRGSASTASGVSVARQPVVAARRSGAAAGIAERLTGVPAATLDDLRTVQHDVVPFNGDLVMGALKPLQNLDSELEAARARLLNWNRQITIDSSDALLYVAFESRLLARASATRFTPPLADGFTSWFADALLAGLATAEPDLLRESLRAAVDDLRRLTNSDSTKTWGAFHSLTFRHPLAITSRASGRYNVGPIPMPGSQSTLFGAWTSPNRRSLGPVVQLLIDVADWDRSRGIVPPGQSAAPDSPHFADLAPLWARGEDVPLPFSAAAVAAAAESTLVLEPR